VEQIQVAGAPKLIVPSWSPAVISWTSSHVIPAMHEEASALIAERVFAGQ
jgi:hypothetical protein